MKILFATSEVYPLVKTGGLADVSAGLSAALHALGEEVLVVMPAYADALAAAQSLQLVATTERLCCGVSRTVKLLRAQAPGLDCPLLLVEIGDLFARSGNPYQSADGEDWWDNGERFGAFSQVVAEIAMNRSGLNWQPDVVHCHDWQTGLVPALLHREASPPRTLFTIHNLSYGGYFPYPLFESLDLDPAWWHFERLEFYGMLSMLKAGIVFADQVTTVSPSYAEEICSEEQGFGLHGALQLRRRAGRLHGVLNGIDNQVWNPARDPYLDYPYSSSRGRVAQKMRTKLQVLEQYGAEHPALLAKKPLFGFVGRLVEQKGIDLFLQVIPQMIRDSDACFVVLGAGSHIFEEKLRVLAAAFDQRLFVQIGYSESLAHRLVAASDIFLMPSRFEPCGLNQMYSLAYGTPPVVHSTGGLKDTVIDASAELLAAGLATGFVFAPFEPQQFYTAMMRALELYHHPRRWQRLQKTGMQQDFGWQSSAKRYLELYQFTEITR